MNKRTGRFLARGFSLSSIGLSKFGFSWLDFELARQPIGVCSAAWRKNVSDRKYLRGTKATLEFARYFINFLEFSAVFSLFILQKVTHTHNFLFYFSWVNTRPSFRKRSKRPSDFSLSLVFLSSPRPAFFSPLSSNVSFLHRSLSLCFCSFWMESSSLIAETVRSLRERAQTSN